MRIEARGPYGRRRRPPDPARVSKLARVSKPAKPSKSSPSSQPKLTKQAGAGLPLRWVFLLLQKGAKMAKNAKNVLSAEAKTPNERIF